VPENSNRTPRRRERQKATIPISLVLEAAPLHADDSAFTVDVSPRGVCVRTKLALVRGEWVRVVTKEKKPRSIPALVIWVRKDESNDMTLAGLQFY
jgi:hypothetical protein